MEKLEAHSIHESFAEVHSKYCDALNGITLSCLLFDCMNLRSLPFCLWFFDPLCQKMWAGSIFGSIKESDAQES